MEFIPLVESIAHGKATPVDELQVQGVYNPGVLRKVSPYCLRYSIVLVWIWWKA